MAKALKNKDNNKSSINGIQSDQGLIVKETKDIANILGNSYFKIHKLTENKSDNLTKTEDSQTVRNIYHDHVTTPQESLTTPSKIKTIIRKLKNKKAPGNDNVTNLALNHLPRITLFQLYHILNACLKLQYFPKKWKEAVILPLLKPGKSSQIATSYRPISLLPTMGKILEKIILTRLSKYESKHKHIIPEQFGFRNKHSTTLQLGRITDIISKNFNIKKLQHS